MKILRYSYNKLIKIGFIVDNDKVINVEDLELEKQ